MANLDDIQIFVKVAQFESISRAARSLGMPISTVSRRLSVLESNLGVSLDARGEYARAESAYRHSLDLDPENATTLLNLGTNLIAQNKGAEDSVDADHLGRQRSKLRLRRPFLG